MKFAQISCKRRLQHTKNSFLIWVFNLAKKFDYRSTFFLDRLKNFVKIFFNRVKISDFLKLAQKGFLNLSELIGLLIELQLKLK